MQSAKTVLYIHMSISSFPTCAVELQGMDGRNIVESNIKGRRESGLSTRIERITRKKKP